MFGVALVIPRYLFGLNAQLYVVSEWIVWYSGIPVTLGVGLTPVDLLVLMSHKRPDVPVRFDPVTKKRVTVSLTAYNDDQSVGKAVRDFLSSPFVGSVIVVSNNSTDNTIRARLGSGRHHVQRNETGVWKLCLSLFPRGTCPQREQPDRSLQRRHDVSGGRHREAAGLCADIVNGTRTVERLRAHSTQLTTFMFYGNRFVGKLLEFKHLGRATLTDVGTTYKLCRRQAVEFLLSKVDPAVNLEFNAHFLDRALEYGLTVVECPVTFHPRWGDSKGSITFTP